MAIRRPRTKQPKRPTPRSSPSFSRRAESRSSSKRGKRPTRATSVRPLPATAACTNSWSPATTCRRAVKPARSRDLYAELLFHERDVTPGSVGQIAGVADFVERLGPARERLVDRRAVMEVGLVGGKLLGLAPVPEAVADADRQLAEGRQHVELRQRQGGHSVQANGVAKRDQVEPAAAALAARDRSEFASELAQALLVGAFYLGRERPLADARHICLGNADHLVDPGRADADARRRAARDRARGGDEWIRPVVEIEQRCVRALEQDGLALAQQTIDQQ